MEIDWAMFPEASTGMVACAVLAETEHPDWAPTLNEAEKIVVLTKMFPLSSKLWITADSVLSASLLYVTERRAGFTDVKLAVWLFI
jgi:hypothetical protein